MEYYCCIGLWLVLVYIAWLQRTLKHRAAAVPRRPAQPDPPAETLRDLITADQAALALVSRWTKQAKKD